MNGAMIRAGIQTVTKALQKNAPAIAAGIGVASIFTTAVLAIKSTPEAHAVTEDGKAALEEAREVYSDPEEYKQECKQIRKTMAKQYVKLYWPAAASAAIGTASIIFSHRVSTKRNMALASAYAITLSEYREFRKQAREMKLISPEKEHQIKDNINKKRIIESKNEPILGVSGSGRELFFDSWSGQKFYSTVNEVTKAVNEFNFELNREMDKPINDLYYKLGIRQVPAGDLYYDCDHGPIEVSFGSVFIEEDGKSYITMDFDREPRLG